MTSYWWCSCNIGSQWTFYALTSFLAVIVWSIKLRIIIRQLNAGNYKVILLIRSMGPQNQPVHTVVLSLWSVDISHDIYISATVSCCDLEPEKVLHNSHLPGDIWEPLSSEAWPLQSMGHDQIIEERGVLLPNLILLVDHPFLHSVIKSRCNSNI